LEFAEYNCAACHHELQPPNPKDKAAGSDWRNDVLNGRPLGVPPWQTIWPLTPAIGLTPPQPSGLFDKAKTKYEPGLRALIKTMEAPRPPSAEKVRPLATKTAGELTALRLELNAWPDAAFVGEAERVFAKLDPRARDLDSGLQLFFGLAALDRARSRGATPNPAFRAATDAYRATGLSDAERWEKFRPPLETLLARPDK
jgi:hypothetical protein